MKAAGKGIDDVTVQYASITTTTLNLRMALPKQERVLAFDL
jgi:hypothetical protein